MRRGRIFSVATVAVIAAAVGAAPGALANPQEVYNDFAVDGKLDAHTAGQLSASLQNPTVQGYGNPVVEVVVPETPPGGGTTPPAGGTTPPAGGTTPPAGGTTPPAGGATPPSGGVAGEEETSTTTPAGQAGGPAAGVAGQEKTLVAAPAGAQMQGQLPFTGAELALYAALGLALLGSGLLMRVTAGQKSGD